MEKWQKILETDHVIEKINHSEDLITICFENLKEKLKIQACSQCCDFNEFLKLENINLLVGCSITSIIENDYIDIESFNENNYIIQFPIIIKYHNKNLLKILEELREKSYLWKKLPKDMFNLLKQIILVDNEYIFYRQNTSNGYYSGYLQIQLN